LSFRRSFALNSERSTLNFTPKQRVASYALRPGDTLAQAARKIIGKQTARLKANIDGTRAGVDPEALHDMRVATRRLRFALRLFAPWMAPGRAGRLRADLRRVALVLGRVRDLDVLLEDLPALMDQADLAPEQRHAVTAALKRRRSQGRAVLVRMLTGERFVQLVLILERAPVQPGTGGPAREEATRMLRAAARQLRGWGRKADLNKPQDLHRLRILFKRLRYTCEYFNDLYAGSLDGAIARLIRFQDCLGRYQDAVAAAAILNGLNMGDDPCLLKLQAVLRGQRGLQREAFSELWPDFVLILRAFSQLLRLETPPPPAALPAAMPAGRGR
jgi:CHAD domain-containing protein